MVRINLLNPACLADQHLIAEYNEILMLLGYVRKYPHLDAKKIPKNYCLGKGHILFFKNKLKYLKKRHDLIKKEMKKRGFAAERTINLSNFKSLLHSDWRASEKDKAIIRKRLVEKIMKKPDYYRYCGKRMPKEFFIRKLMKK